MPARELVVLGTASQVPTRHRNHNGYLLRWDDEVVLFDPGEGAQRQMIHAGVPVSSITRICITHFHGDHCLGLPGILQRLSLDRITRPVDVYFPAAGREHFEHLRRASVFRETVNLRVHPVTEPGVVAPGPPFALSACPLAHRIETLGWRLDEPAGRRMLPARLEAAGIRGPDIGRLQREGALVVDGRRVSLEEVSEPRPGQAFAFVMDTAPCEGMLDLAREADMLVCESTFLAEEEEMAKAFGHLTAAQSGRLAARAGARLLLLTHFSQRHPDESVFEAEAREEFPDALAATDLLRVPVPMRR